MRHKVGVSPSYHDHWLSKTHDSFCLVRGSKKDIADEPIIKRGEFGGVSQTVSRNCLYSSIGYFISTHRQESISECPCRGRATILGDSHP